MNFVRYIKARRIYRIGVTISFILFVLMGFLTFYGQNTGNFVMTVDEDAYKRGLVISTDPEFSTVFQWLTAEPVEDVRDISYKSIEVDNVLNTNGPYKGEKKYLAFTFYILNSGVETTDVSYNVYITQEINNMSKAIRFLLITDGNSATDYDTFKMYMSPDEKHHEYPKTYPTASYFADNKTICNEVIKGLRPQQVKKISIMMWLEGEDPDCVIELFGSKIKLEMDFAIYSDN